MPDGQLIEFDHVTKRFGSVAAVADFSARVNPGVVTGFLGPNGAGKTTTLRVLLGLERPSSGTATIGGTRYAELRNPARVVGAMLEDPGFRPRRTVERHLIAAAKSSGIPLARVGELISFVGLDGDVDTRIAALSLGMRQRLNAATALIGDPGVLVLDEPANGLDPEGIRWMRTLIRGLADEGRTVLVSSHVLSEIEQTVDEILVIARGELKFAGTMENLADPRTGPVVVDAVDRAALSTTLRDAGYEFEVLRSGLTVRGSDAATIGSLTAGAGVALTTLQQRGPTLEDVFLDLVNDRYQPPAAPVVPDATTALPVIAESETEPVVADEPAAAPVGAAEDEPVTEDDRPLPGLAGLAAMASAFNSPTSATAPVADEASSVEPGSADEFFDALTGDPASDHDTSDHDATDDDASDDDAVRDRQPGESASDESRTSSPDEQR